jgi:hypothetical protein
MRRTTAITALAMLAILTPVAAILAGPDAPWIAPTKDLTPYAALRHTVACRPGGKTVAIAWGTRGTAIGLYVYGPDGQCIASDDAPGERLDDRIVSFVPTVAGPYEMSVRSFSGRTNPVEMSLRASGRSE